MTLEDLVPPLELCKRIPAGEFGESALVYTLVGARCREGEVFDIIVVTTRERGKKVNIQAPAPTLEEILKELAWVTLCDHINDAGERDYWCLIASLEDFSSIMEEHDNNPAAAALRLWLKVKGME